MPLPARRRIASSAQSRSAPACYEAQIQFITKKTNIHIHLCPYNSEKMIDDTQAVGCSVCSCGCHCTTFSCSSYPTQAHFRLNLIILAHHHEGKLSGYCAIIICEVTHVSLPFSLKFIPGFTFFRTVLRLYTIFLTPHLHKRVGHVGGPCPQRALQSVPPGPILHFKKQPYPTNFVLVFGLVSVQECVYLVLCLHISKVVCSLQTERRFFETWSKPYPVYKNPCVGLEG